METSQTRVEERRISLPALDTILVGGIFLFLFALPFHLVIKRLLPEPVGTYWKEGLLAILVLVWGIESIRERRFLITQTVLDLPVALYVGLLLLRLVLDGTGLVAAWGFYASFLYLPLFWLVATILKKQPERLIPLLTGLVAAGSIAALGGLVEFVLDRALWPSPEFIQTQGFPDVYVYGTTLRRVYFVFDSPTTLANTLAMLVPLALVLMILAKKPWQRGLAGLAAAAMAACIVVTFSRGVWVALAFSLVLIGVFGGWVSKNRRVLAVAAGVLGLAALAWLVVVVARPAATDALGTSVVELPPADYRSAPVVSVQESLFDLEPEAGGGELQTWTLMDPIQQEEDTRPVLFEHPNQSVKSEIRYQVEVPEHGALKFSIALSPEVWSPDKGDGTSFEVFVADPENPEAGKFAFVRYINPKLNPNDRIWRNFLVDLSSWSGQTVNLSLITEAGPAGDWGYDWAGWSGLEMVSLPAGYFDSAQAENAVLEHTGSILDWAQDETNRDRLAAWSKSLSAWRSAPIWGTGLGSTGMAALRTQPETAFVTESQVLKALTELGLPGVIVLAFLWFLIFYSGGRAYLLFDDPNRKILILGIMASLLVVLMDGMVYQNLEVKQVNAYFWTLTGVLAFLLYLGETRLQAEIADIDPETAAGQE